MKIKNYNNQQHIRRRAKLLAYCLSLFVLASCSGDDMEGYEPATGNGNSGDIAFEIGFASQPNGQHTRVTTASDFKSTWSNGDQIGLFACTSGTALAASGNHLQNVKLTYSSANGGTWTPSEPLWWPSSGGKLDFFAYYPYSATATDPINIVFNVQTDQSTSAAYNNSDLLTAKASQSGGYGKGETVPLTFSHALAMVQVSIPYEGKGMGASAGLDVKLRSVKTNAVLNLGAISTTQGSEVSLASDNNNAQNISMYRVEQAGDADYETSYTYRALVPAQSIAQGASLFFFNHEERQLLTDKPLSAVLAMTAGQAELFTRTLPATLIETVAIPKGTFIMGSPTSEPDRSKDETQHQVTLTQDFRMSKYQVTFAQYDAFCDATGRSKPSDEGWGRGDRPVINVNWEDATAYCTWLSEQTGLNCTLPTEAQWEYACRGSYANKGTEWDTLPFGIGDGTKLVYGMANYWIQYSYSLPGGEYNVGNNTGYLGKTNVVGSYEANNYDLYDMHGNVWEWCSDWYASYSGSAVTDPTGPTSGNDRVLRGGSWNNGAQYCRSAYRRSYNPGIVSVIIGFRVVFVH